MDKVIIFSAPSGSGKTTLVRHALQVFPELEFSISCTTRSPRGEEVDGKDYYFISAELFKTKIDNKEFVEYEEVYQDRFYGTLKNEVDRIWKSGKVVIFDVDVKGGIALKSYFKEKALSIFITAPSIEELERRLLERATDDLETIKVRVEKAYEEIKFKNDFDKNVINSDLQKAQREVEHNIRTFLYN